MFIQNKSKEREQLQYCRDNPMWNANHLIVFSKRNIKKNQKATCLLKSVIAIQSILVEMLVIRSKFIYNI